MNDLTGAGKRDNVVVDSGGRPQAVTADHVMRLMGSLDAASIVEAFQAVCSELLGSCETAVFLFVPDDRTRMVRFGEGRDTGPVPAPRLEDGVSLNPESPIEAAPGGGGAFRAHLALRDNDDDLGVLRVAFDRPLGGAGVQVLSTLVRGLGAAVRNSQQFEKTERLTFTDDLTALYNSRFMALYLDREIKRCRRMRSPLSLLFLDLDGFKEINDIHGHLCGSRTLVEVGAVLEKTVREADVLIRYGGDEFVILFPETPLAGGLIIAERIRATIGDTKFLESQRLDARVTASIGIAAYPESADDVRGLISGADRAMYEAKALGKNRVVAASPLKSPESSKRP